LGGIDAAYNVLLRLTGKHVVDFLIVIIELLSTGFTADELQTNIE